MIVLTGDTHREFGRIEEFCMEYETTTEDVMVVLGDAGINFYLNESDERVKCELDQLPITLFCIHGNHEERPEEIASYIEKKWHGGIVYMEEEHPTLLFAKDGEVYDFDGSTAIAIGGAYSIDKYWRLANNVPWFDTEQPDEYTKERVEQKLISLDWHVDYVFSHTVPRKYEPTEVFLPSIDERTVDKSTEDWLDSIENRLDYSTWYCGHYHTDKIDGRVRLMFDDFEELDW